MPNPSGAKVEDIAGAKGAGEVDVLGAADCGYAQGVKRASCIA